MTDIQHLINLLREFADHKRAKADAMLDRMGEYQFETNKTEKARDLLLDALRILDYADEIARWAENGGHHTDSLHKAQPYPCRK